MKAPRSSKRLIGIISLLTPLYAPMVQAGPSEPLTLEWVLSEVRTKNPNLAVAASELEAAGARVHAEPLLPAPTVSVGTMGANGPFSSKGKMEFSVEASQSIPFPTKFSARSRAASREERASQQALRAREYDLKSEAVGAYFEYLGVQKKIRLLNQITQVYHDHLKRLRAGPFATSLMQAHLLATQGELDVVENDLEAARADKTAAQATLNALVGREADAPLGEAEDRPAPAPPTNLSSVQLKRIAEEHPRLTALAAKADAMEAKADLGRKAWIPDFMLTYRHNRRFDEMPTNSELMVGLSLPFVFPWQPKSEAAVAAAEWHTSQAQLTVARSEFRRDLAKAFAQLTSRYARLMNYERKILPQAEKRMKIIHGLSASDMEGLTEHLDAMKAFIELNMKALEERVEYEKSLAAYRGLAETQTNETGVTP